MKILYRDVERILDTRITISVEQQHPVIPILEKEADAIPLDFHLSGRDSHIDLFICADAAQKLKGILSQFNPRNRGDCLMVRINADEMRTASTILEETATVKTAVRGGLYLKGDNILADYRFHSSSSADITEIGRKIISLKNRTRISDLGPTYGGISAIDSVNGRIRLGVVTYEADILDGTGLLSGRDCYIEYNFSRQEENGFRAIVYQGDEFSVRYIRSSFLDDVQRLSEERRIPKAAILARTLEGRYRSSTFLPFSMLDDQLSVLYSASEKYPEAKFNLVAVRLYDRSVWDWI